MGAEHKDRHELLVTFSVAIMVQSTGGHEMLLVKKRQTGQWGVPAGGFKYLHEEGRLETADEAMRRELQEETGLVYPEDKGARPLAIINLPGSKKNRVGVIYQRSFDFDLHEANPQDTNEVAEAKLFKPSELAQLLDEQDAIYKPEFNRGMIVWWVRNLHRDATDPYRGAEPPDDQLDELFLARYANPPLV